MNTGPKNYEIASEMLAALADDMSAGHVQTEQDIAKAHLVAVQAQAYATLALAAATGLNDPVNGAPVPDGQAWIDAASTVKDDHR